MARRGGTPENLIRVPKGGPSPNPNGRPKKLPELDKLLADVLGEEKDGLTAAEAILKKLRQMATGGNLRAAEILLDRGYGKPRQSITADISHSIAVLNIDPLDDSADNGTP